MRGVIASYIYTSHTPADEAVAALDDYGRRKMRFRRVLQVLRPVLLILSLILCVMMKGTLFDGLEVVFLGLVIAGIWAIGRGDSYFDPERLRATRLVLQEVARICEGSPLDVRIDFRHVVERELRIEGDQLDGHYELEWLHLSWPGVSLGVTRLAHKTQPRLPRSERDHVPITTVYNERLEFITEEKLQEPLPPPDPKRLSLQEFAAEAGQTRATLTGRRSTCNSKGKWKDYDKNAGPTICSALKWFSQNT